MATHMSVDEMQGSTAHRPGTGADRVVVMIAVNQRAGEAEVPILEVK